MIVVIYNEAIRFDSGRQTPIFGSAFTLIHKSGCRRNGILRPKKKGRKAPNSVSFVAPENITSPFRCRSTALLRAFGSQVRILPANEICGSSVGRAKINTLYDFNPENTKTSVVRERYFVQGGSAGINPVIVFCSKQFSI